MAIVDDPVELSREVAAGIRYRNRVLEGLDEMNDAIAGPGYLAGVTGDIENYGFEYLSLMLAQCVFTNPRVKVETALPGMQGDTASMLGHGLSRWVYVSKYRRVLVDVFSDMLKKYGVLHTTPEKERGYTIETWNPVVRCLPPKRFGLDPLCEKYEQRRFAWHEYICDKAALLKRAETEEGWDKKTIEGLGAGSGVSRDDDEVDTNRIEIGVCEIFVPEINDFIPKNERGEAEEGYHGTIFTLVAPGDETDGPSPVYLREPYAFYGPYCGPYTLFSCYPTGKGPYRLAPLSAVMKQGQLLQDIAKAAQLSAEAYKRLIIVEQTDTELVENIKNGKHLHVFGSKMFDPRKAAEYALGGVDAQQYTWYESRRQLVDRVLGMSDAQRGVVTGQGTATENTIAASSSSARVDYIKQEFHDAVSENLTAVGWYLYNDARAFLSLGDGGYYFGGNTDTEAGREDQLEAVRSRFPQRVELAEEERDALKEIGGTREDAQAEAASLVWPVDEETGVKPRYEDLQITIEPYSMERTSEAQQAMQGKFLLELASTVGPIIPQLVNGGVDMKKVLDRLGDSVNIPNLSEILDVNQAQAAHDEEVKLELASKAHTGSEAAKPQPMGYQKPASPKPETNNRVGPGVGNRPASKPKMGAA